VIFFLTFTKKVTPMKTTSTILLVTIVIFGQNVISKNPDFSHGSPQESNSPYKKSLSLQDSVDVFELPYSLKIPLFWHLSSVPQKQTEAEMFPETVFSHILLSGFNRAKLAWYMIDPLFYDTTFHIRPQNIDDDEISNHLVREIVETDIFPDLFYPLIEPYWNPGINLAFYPSERGPYNFDTQEIPGISAGIVGDGSLKNPETRWGGIMRHIEITDFETENVQYIEFRIMDPFVDGQTAGGDLYINIGDISEDILMDSRMQYENGLPISENFGYVDTTIWGCVPTFPPPPYNNFSPVSGSREYQDVGLDGLSDDDECSYFFTKYLNILLILFGPDSEAYQKAIADPSCDNFHYFRGSDYDVDSLYSSILQRYKNFNGTDGNSPTDVQNPEAYPIAATTMPDVEDINHDNVFNEAENYFQYKIELTPDKMNVGENYISGIIETDPIPLPNGSYETARWYRFRIPIHEYSMAVGDISDFSNIRFIRLFLKNFAEPTVLRFATFELVRIMENPKNLDFKIFPNPIKTHFWLEFPEPIQKAFDISITNIMGKMMFEKTYPFDIYKYFSVDISTLRPGAYVLMLSTSKNQVAKKIIVYR